MTNSSCLSIDESILLHQVLITSNFLRFPDAIERSVHENLGKVEASALLSQVLVSPKPVLSANPAKQSVNQAFGQIDHKESCTSRRSNQPFATSI